MPIVFYHRHSLRTVCSSHVWQGERMVVLRTRVKGIFEHIPKYISTKRLRRTFKPGCSVRICNVLIFSAKTYWSIRCSVTISAFLSSKWRSIFGFWFTPLSIFGRWWWGECLGSVFWIILWALFFLNAFYTCSGICKFAFSSYWRPVTRFSHLLTCELLTREHTLQRNWSYPTHVCHFLELIWVFYGADATFWDLLWHLEVIMENRIEDTY